MITQGHLVGTLWGFRHLLKRGWVSFGSQKRVPEYSTNSLDKHTLNEFQVLHSDMSFDRKNLCIFHVLAKLARGVGTW